MIRQPELQRKKELFVVVFKSPAEKPESQEYNLSSLQTRFGLYEIQTPFRIQGLSINSMTVCFLIEVSTLILSSNLYQVRSSTGVLEFPGLASQSVIVSEAY